MPNPTSIFRNVTAGAISLFLGFMGGIAQAEVVVSSTPLAEPSAPDADTMFTRLEGFHIGVERPLEFSMQDLWPPFWNPRGTASGDVDNDGDDDLLMASTDRTLHLFSNDGTGHFTETTPALGDLEGAETLIASLVDLDNDGWLDIFVSAYDSGLYVLWNEQGSFSDEHVSSLSNNPLTTVSQATGFGDLNQDGLLDIYVGNWTAGHYRHFPGEESRNGVLLNDGDRFSTSEIQLLDGMTAETLSVLISDFDDDGDPDLFEASDFDPADQVYRNDQAEGFTRITRDMGLFEITSHTTMSIKSADLDNDLVPELYFSQIAGTTDGVSDNLNMRPFADYCHGMERETDRAACQQNVDILSWYGEGGRRVDVGLANKCAELPAEQQQECAAVFLKDIALQRREEAICDRIADTQVRMRTICHNLFLRGPVKNPYLVETGLPQTKHTNVLLQRQADYTYADRTHDFGLEYAGWSWDTKIEDFDLDGYQDIYITNGYMGIVDFSPANVYFANQDGETFEQLGAETGLVEHLILASLTRFDLENDGDPDLIGQPVNGPVIAFRNNAQNPNRIVFSLSDDLANQQGIGSKIVIYTDDGSAQMREIQLSGGYRSYDSAKVFFGLGEAERVTRVEIFWSDGSIDMLDQEFLAGNHYLLSRVR